MVTTLFSRAAAGLDRRKELFERHVRESNKQAYNLALRLTGTAADAEDLVQETFVRAFRFFHRYDASMPFSSWLYRIMTNLHIDGVRKSIRLRTTSMDQSTDGMEWQLADPKASPDREAMAYALNDELQLGLLSMNAEFRIAVLLSDVEGMAYEEIAEIMQTSIGTVRSRIHRGRKQLREYLVGNCPDVYAEVSA